MVKVGIIIVTWQAERYLPDLMRSLFEYWPLETEARVFWVENNSTDGTREWIAKWRSEHPAEDSRVEWIMSERNTGFCGGNNLGIKKAIAWGAASVYLLNQDTEVTARWLDEVMCMAQNDPKIASVQSLLLLHPTVAPGGRRDIINSAGNKIHYLGFCYCGGLGNPNPYTLTPIPSIEITYGMGAGMLYRASILNEVGLFDEEAFAYHDDNDLGLRFRIAGYKNVLALKSIVYHKYNSKLSANKFFWNERARYLNVLKFYSGRTLLLLAPALIMFEVALWGWSILHGFERSKARATWWLITHLGWIRERRQSMQRIRKVGDRELVKFFTGKFEVEEMNSPMVKVGSKLFDWYWRCVRKLISNK